MTVGLIQQIGMVGLIASVIVFNSLLPPRPVHVPPVRRVTMWLQWVLYPLTLLVFNSSTALHSQWRLLTGRYRERFDVTEKVSGVDAGLCEFAAPCQSVSSWSSIDSVPAMLRNTCRSVS